MTTPSTAELAAFLHATYQLAAPPELAHLRDGQGQSRIYRVQLGAEPAILRLYGPQPDCSPAWIAAEAAWLEHLQSQGCCVAAPLPLPDGSYVATLPGGGYACLFSFAEGAPQWPPTPAQSRQLGAALARIHAASDSFAYVGPLRHYDRETLLDTPLRRMQPFIPSAEDRAELQQLADQIARALSTIPQGAPYHGMIHGDVHQGNAHFAADQPTLFDFTLCGRGPRVYDFTGFLWPLRDETIDKPGIREACDHFLAGYQSVRPLHEAETAAIPACIKARDLWETGDWIAHDPGADPSDLQAWMQTLLARFRKTPLTC